VECDYRGWIGCCPQVPGWIRDAVEYVFRCFVADQDHCRLIRNAVEHVFRRYFVEHDHCGLNVNDDGLDDRPDDDRLFPYLYGQHADSRSDAEYRPDCNTAAVRPLAWRRA
jgi:hypothetical protein